MLNFEGHEKSFTGLRLKQLELYGYGTMRPGRTSRAGPGTTLKSNFYTFFLRQSRWCKYVRRFTGRVINLAAEAKTDHHLSVLHRDAADVDQRFVQVRIEILPHAGRRRCANPRRV